ncbi:hypothetical protein MJO28_017776 [Puccinia striiformis f. sp. tritici]|nr:hypothetical protein MJO28_017776 [Puccinia striiformis f. sp. tritici]
MELIYRKSPMIDVAASPKTQNCIIGMKKCCDKDMSRAGPKTQHAPHHVWSLLTPGKKEIPRRQMCVSQLERLGNGDPNNSDLGILNHLREPLVKGTGVHERIFEAVVQQVRSGLWESVDI